MKLWQECEEFSNGHPSAIDDSLCLPVHGCHSSTSSLLSILQATYAGDGALNVTHMAISLCSAPTLLGSLCPISPNPIHQHDVILKHGPRGRLQRVHVRGSGYFAARFRAHRPLLHPCHVIRQASVYFVY